MFLDIALLTSGFGILQKILSIRALLLLDILVGRRIWGCNELDSRSSRKVLTFSNVPKLNRAMLKSPRKTIILFASLERLSNNGLGQWSSNVRMNIHACMFYKYNQQSTCFSWEKQLQQKLIQIYLAYKWKGQDEFYKNASY